mmetsp:Transcript_29292/g.86765  ORF Transcript_29292/g.86765 Transcript_29292/m.86765 type:complete len:255 (-) Transcript_29292:237-1001(-)
MLLPKSAPTSASASSLATPSRNRPSVQRGRRSGDRREEAGGRVRQAGGALSLGLGLGANTGRLGSGRRGHGGSVRGSLVRRGTPLLPKGKRRALLRKRKQGQVRRGPRPGRGRGVQRRFRRCSCRSTAICARRGSTSLAAERHARERRRQRPQGVTVAASAPSNRRLLRGTRNSDAELPITAAAASAEGPATGADAPIPRGRRERSGRGRGGSPQRGSGRSGRAAGCRLGVATGRSAGGAPYVAAGTTAVHRGE